MYCKERGTLPLITGQEEKGKGGARKRESGGGLALQSRRPLLSASFVTGFRELSLDVLFVGIGASWQNPVPGSAHGAMS